MTRVLVAHASKYGSVEEVARYIAAVLRDRGAACTVVPARQAEHLVDYDFVVLGTGLYMGRLHREARRFLRRHHEELADVPFAVFAMGPLSASPRSWRRCGRSSSGAWSATRTLHPFVAEIFGGVIDPDGCRSRTTTCRPATTATGTRSGASPVSFPFAQRSPRRPDAAKRPRRVREPTGRVPFSAERSAPDDGCRLHPRKRTPRR